MKVISKIHFYILIYCLLSVSSSFKKLKESEISVTMEDVPNTDHFNVIEQLVDGEYCLTKVRIHIISYVQENTLAHNADCILHHLWNKYNAKVKNIVLKVKGTKKKKWARTNFVAKHTIKLLKWLQLLSSWLIWTWCFCMWSNEVEK